MKQRNQFKQKNSTTWCCDVQHEVMGIANCKKSIDDSLYIDSVVLDEK